MITFCLTLTQSRCSAGAFGGTTTGSDRYCHFPFIYAGVLHRTCLDARPPFLLTGQSVLGSWCSLTGNFDRDFEWGFCKLGMTHSVSLDVCLNATRTLQCPVDYTVIVSAADYAAKPGGNISNETCTYNSNDCFQTDLSTVQRACVNMPSCVISHYPKILSSCEYRASAYLHIEHACVPSNVSEMVVYSLCGSNTTVLADNERAVIISPNYPGGSGNVDCTVHFYAPKASQDIYLYIVDMDLDGMNSTASNCLADRLIVNTGGQSAELCGRSGARFVMRTCGDAVALRLIRPMISRGYGVKLYLELRTRSSDEVCPSSSTTRLPLMTTSIDPFRPSYFPHPSPRLIKTLCYPDMSAMFNTSNFVCPRDYVVAVRQAFFGRGALCSPTPGDCTSPAHIVTQTCSGQPACSVSFANSIYLPECNGTMANYLFVDYICLPTPPIASYISDLCTGQLTIGDGPSGVLKSPSYPFYTPATCPNVTLTTNGSNMIFSLYLLDLYTGSFDNGSTDYLHLSYQCNGEWQSTRLSGLRQTEYLFDTCTPTDRIVASYNLADSNTQSYRGFALFYHLLPGSSMTTTIASTQPTTSAIPTGFGLTSTEIQRTTTCTQQARLIRCGQLGYVLVIRKATLVVSPRNTCFYSDKHCFVDFPSLSDFCNGQSSCTFVPPSIVVPACNYSQSSYLYVEHQCIPTQAQPHVNICSFINPLQMVDPSIVISSVPYTSTFQTCEIRLQAKNASSSDGLRVYVLTFDLPGGNRSAPCDENHPFVDVDDLNATSVRQCRHSKPRFLFETFSKTIEILYRNVPVNSNTSHHYGFELFVESITSREGQPTPPLAIAREVVCARSTGCDHIDVRCPLQHGLVILQSYNFVTKQPGQCNLNQHSCHYPNEQVHAQCAGRQTCHYTYNISSTGPSHSCPGQQPDATEFYYQCLPMQPSVHYPVYTLCRDEQTNANMGFIETSPGNESRQCSLMISSRNATIYLYVMYLSIPPAVSEMACDDSIEYNTGNETYIYCGNITQPMFLYQTQRNHLVITAHIVHEWRGARLFYIVGNQDWPLPPAVTHTTASTSHTLSTTETSTVSSK